MKKQEGGRRERIKKRDKERKRERVKKNESKKSEEKIRQRVEVNGNEITRWQDSATALYTEQIERPSKKLSMHRAGRRREMGDRGSRIEFALIFRTWESANILNGLTFLYIPVYNVAAVHSELIPSSL